MSSADPNAVPLLPTVDLRPVYLTAEQVGELLQVKAKTVYGWATDDVTMPRLKIGGTIRFPRERLLRWLADREQGRARPRRVTAERAPGTLAARQSEGDPAR